MVITANQSFEGRLGELAVAELTLMERRWSRFLPSAELSRLNAAAGKSVIVSADTFSVIESAIEAWRRTNGFFDPTIHDALCASGYDRISGRLPAPALPQYRPDPSEPRQRVRRVLAGLGLDEVVSHALIGPDGLWGENSTPLIDIASESSSISTRPPAYFTSGIITS